MATGQAALTLLIAGILSAFIASAADLTGFSGVWHFLNVQAVECPGAAGYANISISKPADNLHRPHVLTVFRTTNDAVRISFTVTDSANKVIATQSGLTLQAITSGSRRLSGTAAGESYNQDAEMVDEVHKTSEDEKDNEMKELDVKLEVVDDSEILHGPRRLSARRRGGGRGGGFSSYSRSRSYSSYSSPRRRAPSYSSYSSPRRRGASSYTSPRRRGASSSSGYSSYSYPRRRGFTQPTGTRRRSIGYDSKSFSNPHSPVSGRYGYTSSSYATSQYGGRLPMSTSYGYTGANAYKSSSGMKIAMAAGGGLLAGYAVSSVMHNMHNPYGYGYGYTDMYNPFGYTRAEMLSMGCTYGTWSGLCSSCITTYSANQCNVQFTPKVDATRDDLMGTGFIPADYTWPLLVKVTDVTSTAFPASEICPPNNGVDSTWKAPPMKQLFLTLTTIEELGQDAGTDTDSGNASSWAIGVLSLSCCMCACCACSAWGMSKKGKKHKFNNYSSSSDSEMEMHYGGHPGAWPPPPVFPAGGNPYWNPPGQGGVASMQSAGSNHSFRGADGGFMSTAAPNGKSWDDYCQPHEVFMSEHSQSLNQPWGECMAWAKAYEHNNPGWENDPRMRGGPCAHVIQAMCERAPDHMSGSVVQAAEMLEEACEDAIRHGRPLPVINQRV